MNAPRKTRTNRTLLLTSALVGIGLLVGQTTWAEASKAPAPKNDLAISLTAQKVLSQANGQEKLVPAEVAFPGEVIQYDALYSNQSASQISHVSPVLPIPRGMVYVPDSAKPAPAEASLDGRKFEPIPLRRVVSLPNGEQKEEEVPPSQYRALRWNLGEMAAGAKATVTARAKLVPVGR